MLPDVLALPILMFPLSCDAAMSKSVVVSKELDKILAVTTPVKVGEASGA